MGLDLRGNRYAPSVEQRNDLKERLATSFEPSGQFLTLIELHGDDPTSDLCRVLEQSVFHEAFGSIVPHTPDMMTAEYGPYESRSRFLTAVESSTMSIVGTIRIIEGYPNKTTKDLTARRLVKTEDLESTYHFRDERTWDIGSLVVDETFRRALRSNPVSIPLYRALYVGALRNAITHWTSIIDVDVLRFLTRLGIPFQRLMDLDDVTYLGSTATACYLNVANIDPSMSETARQAPRRRRELIEAMLHGSSSTPEIRSRPQFEVSGPNSRRDHEALRRASNRDGPARFDL